jgi:hypothetical protein
MKLVSGAQLVQVVSSEAPLGRALLGKCEGDELSVPGAAPPEVEHLEIDASQQNLLLRGKYFKTNGTAVSLGHHRLEVTESSQTNVVARLPSNLRPATYRVLVSSSYPHVNAASLYLQIPQKPGSVLAAAGDERPRE